MFGRKETTLDGLAMYIEDQHIVARKSDSLKEKLDDERIPG